MPTSTNPGPTSLVRHSRRAQPRQNDVKCRRFRKPSLPQLMRPLRTPFSRAAGAFALCRLPKSTANPPKHLRALCPSEFGPLLRGLSGPAPSVSSYRSTLPLWPPNTRPIRNFSLENRRRPSRWRSPGASSGRADRAQTWRHRRRGPRPGPTSILRPARVRHRTPSRRNSLR